MVIFCRQYVRTVKRRAAQRQRARRKMPDPVIENDRAFCGAPVFCRMYCLRLHGLVYACMITVSSPIVSSRTVSTSPACSQSRSPSGLPRMTPDGVPVRITSPG